MSVVTKLTIDGQEVRVADGASVLDAARQAGISVPTLCYHPYLKAVGSCRLCVVDIEGYRGLPASCSTPASSDMVVHTRTPRVLEYRQQMLQLHLKDYPLDALTPELRQLIREVGLELPEAAAVERSREKLPGGPFFERDYHYCIHCGRCVRMCHEIRGAQAISFREQRGRMEVGTAFDRPLEDVGCQFCAACVDVCPTTALYDRVDTDAARYKGPTREVASICPYCGVGCRLIFTVRNNHILRQRPDPNGPANLGQACVKGRFGITGFVHHADRLTKPLVRDGGSWREATWAEGLDTVARALARYQPHEVAVMASAKCTNEDNYIFQKFARAVLGTNSVDHCARL
jgi:formate dehydrogenase major subunit/formate dehydrogenase alpha subunit